ncbi:MAG TPA: YIP1 family protein [Gaiella sp.]|nr:YIP1 family protein [Gaiella sp.]
MSERPRVKPVEQADRQGARLAEAGEAASREWWRRVPRIVTAPRPVFAALAETDDVDVDARAEPVLALTILGGMAAMLLAPGWNVMDDWTVDWLVVAVVTFIGALFYGAAGYFLLGLALWLGAKAVGVEAPFKIARQVVAFAALPLVLSLVVVLPTILIGYGEDWFRSGGADDAGDGRTIVTAIGLAFVAWSLVLVGIGLRTTFRLPWRGVVGALLLAGVLVAAFAVLPTAL